MILYSDNLITVGFHKDPAISIITSSYFLIFHNVIKVNKGRNPRLLLVITLLLKILMKPLELKVLQQTLTD